MRNTILPLFAEEKLGASNSVIGLGFTVAAIVQGIALVYVGKISDFRGRKFALMLGSFVMLTGIATIIVSLVALVSSLIILPIGAGIPPAITAVKGMIIFNDTAGIFQGYNGTAWVTLG
jgi:MFS family permease